MQPERFKVSAVPHKAELLDIRESPIALPVRYFNSLNEITSSTSRLRQILVNNEELDSVGGRVPREGVGSSAMVLSDGFMNWLASSEKAQKIMDLIKVDKERLHKPVGGMDGDR